MNEKESEKEVICPFCDDGDRVWIADKGYVCDYSCWREEYHCEYCRNVFYIEEDKPEMTMELVLEKIKIFAKENKGFGQTIGMFLVDEIWIKEIIKDATKYELISEREALVNHIHQTMAGEDMYKPLLETFRDVDDYAAWFRLNVKVLDFLNGLLKELKNEE